jgi:hypothetical protein
LRLIEEVLAKVSAIMDLAPELFANSIDDYSRDLRLAKWGSRVSLHSTNPESRPLWVKSRHWGRRD